MPPPVVPLFPANVQLVAVVSSVAKTWRAAAAGGALVLNEAARQGIGTCYCWDAGFKRTEIGRHLGPAVRAGNTLLRTCADPHMFAAAAQPEFLFPLSCRPAPNRDART